MLLLLLLNEVWQAKVTRFMQPPSVLLLLLCDRRVVGHVPCVCVLNVDGTRTGCTNRVEWDVIPMHHSTSLHGHGCHQVHHIAAHTALLVAQCHHTPPRLCVL